MIQELMDYAFEGEYPTLYGALKARGQLQLYRECCRTFLRREVSLTKRLAKQMAEFFGVDMDTFTTLAIRDEIRIAYRTGARKGKPSLLPADDIEFDTAVQWLLRNHPSLIKNGGIERVTNRGSGEATSDVEGSR